MHDLRFALRQLAKALVFAANTALLVAVATGACLLPALSATRVDPIEALRAE